jgi:cyd operon protein YbgT
LSGFEKEYAIMWYFTWVLGVGFAVLLAIMNAMWYENRAARRESMAEQFNPPDNPRDDA